MKKLSSAFLLIVGMAMLLCGCPQAGDDKNAFFNAFRFVNYTEGGTTHQDWSLSSINTPNVGFAAFTDITRNNADTESMTVRANGTGAVLSNRNFGPGSFDNSFFCISYGDQADVRLGVVKAGPISTGNGGLVIANLDRVRGAIDVRLRRPADGAIVHTVPNLGVGGDLLTQPSQAQLGITPGNWIVYATLPGTTTIVWSKTITVKLNEFTMVLPFDGAGASQDPVPFQVPAF